MESYFQSNDHQFELFQGDATECLKNMSTQFDMIFADPPYFLSRGYSSKINGEWKSFEKGEWDRVTSFDNINEFNRRWLLACRNVLKDDGTIWVSGTYHNIFSVATCLVELGFKVLNIIVWQKCPDLQENKFTFRAKIRPLSDFMGIK